MLEYWNNGMMGYGIIYGRFIIKNLTG